MVRRKRKRWVLVRLELFPITGETAMDFAHYHLRRPDVPVPIELVGNKGFINIPNGTMVRRAAVLYAGAFWTLRKEFKHGKILFTGGTKEGRITLEGREEGND